MARLLFLQNHDSEFLGPMYISAAVKRAGHDCRLAVGDRLEQFAPAIERYRPDLVAFSVMTGGQAWAMGMAAQVKRAYGLGNVFGGPHATFYPAFAAEDPVDIVVRGEGEGAAVDLLDAIAAGRPFDDIANLCFKRNGQVQANPVRPLTEDLDTLAFPDRGLYGPSRTRAGLGVRCVISARGCPYACTFCFEESMRRLYHGKGKAVRLRSADQVIEECCELRDRHAARTIKFADDVFGVNKRWLIEFLAAYKRRVGLPFLCLVRADIVAADADYARRLADAGCRSVFFGIETGNERIRNQVLNKRLSDRDIYQAARLLHRAGIKFRAYNIVGLPDETLDDAFATLRMNIRIKADYPWCSLFAPYPDTALADYARDRGYLDPGFDSHALNESFFVNSQLNMPHIREIQNLQKFFQTAVLWPWALPLIRRLIRLPPNPLFTLWFGLVYLPVYLRSEGWSFWRTLRFALANARHLLK